jgi:uncharacterized membrane protein
MVLAVSLIIALALFSLRLKLQSATYLTTDEVKAQRLADQLERKTLATFVPIGIVMVILGFIFSRFGDSFISIGFTIIGMAVVLLTQSGLTKRKGDEAISFARRVRWWGRLCWWVALVAIIVLIVRIALL